MVVGLTGRICSGKNHVGRLLEQRGFTVWDLDRVAAGIRESRKREVLEIFGTTDSAEIAAMVFSSPEKLRALEGIVYPELEKRIVQYVNGCADMHPGLVLNGALLRRAGLDRLCNFAIYVNAGEATRRKRACGRGMSPADFTLRNNAQGDVDPASCAYACPVFILDNDTDIAFDSGAGDTGLASALDGIFSAFPAYGQSGSG